jgi:hypothetical protein
MKVFMRRNAGRCWIYRRIRRLDQAVGGALGLACDQAKSVLGACKKREGMRVMAMTGV